MTGKVLLKSKGWPMSLALMAAMGLAACDENGEFAFPTADGAQAQVDLPANAPNQRVQAGRDIERPDIFEVTDRGLWDGRSSLGGVWVAHPDVQDPDRVVIRNSENGRSIVGALFRRERENPGPLLQVSSDAAEELGILAGAPTELTVIVLRREEVDVEEVPEVDANPVVASLEAPISVEAQTLDPVEASGASVGAAAAGAAAGAGAVAVVLPPALEAATAAVEQSVSVAAETTQIAATAAATAQAVTAEVAETAETVDVSAVLAPPPAPVEPLPEGSTAQIGIYSVEANAGSDAQTIIASGIQAAVLPEEMGGRTVWRVIAGPLTDTGDIARLKQLGFVDAFVIEDEE